MNKLIVCIMGENCEKFIGMCLESVKSADVIVYCDGGSEDDTLDILFDKYNFDIDKNIPELNIFYDKRQKRNLNRKIIYNPYDQEDKAMNGKQRNFYLKYLKENYPDDWCLVCDADEVVAEDGIEKIKEFIKQDHYTKDSFGDFIGVYSVKMRHFIGDMGHEDNTQQEHFVPNRLFKIEYVDHYPETEHPVLVPINGICGKTTCTTIWHLAYLSGMWEIKKRYLNHMKKSEMHTPEFLKQWYYAHLSGNYPRTPIKVLDIPKVILREFLINPDQVYFNTHSNLEVKHFLMTKQWIDYFKCKNVFDLGCGIGLYGVPMNMLGVIYFGLELSQWAIDNTPYKNLRIKQGDIREKQDFKDFDLVLVFDVLEHLKEEELDKTLDNIKDYGNNFLFSIPYEGDPNLREDPTHRIFKPKEWWVKKLEQYFNIKEAPEDWLFHKQILIGSKK